ncbi:AAA family ATPase [Lentisphaera marina]|uniref:AAA family ATPase n=1 Tax=Lentisphaera marina TaxID=1111041 RepID=UPI0023655158|nr:AAA family ATPase [Lentisphaera marina]MDD7984340.1 AAA family ATPase [Lentisphaera marina]
MNDIDYYLCDYLFYTNYNFSLINIDRDYKKEKELFKLSKMNLPPVPKDTQLLINRTGASDVGISRNSVEWRLLVANFFSQVYHYCQTRNTTFRQLLKNDQFSDSQVRISGARFTKNAIALEPWVDDFVNFDSSQIKVFVMLHNNKKLILPVFMEGINYSPRLLNHIGLYGQQELPLNSRAVILTDSIEMAYRRNFELTRNANLHFSWCSWYDNGNNDTMQLDSVDLSPLKNRQIYYLVMAHSGMSEKTAIQRAISYSQTLESKGVENVKYVLWLKGEENFYNRHPQAPVEPRVFEKGDFVKFFGEAEEKTAVASPGPIRHFYEDRGNQRQLLTPVLNERTCTLISGPKDCGKTWFSMSLAMALFKGCQFIDGWDSRLRADVFYVSGMLSVDAMQKRFDFLGESLGTKITAPVPNRLSWASSNEILNTSETELVWLYRKTKETFSLGNDNLAAPRVLILDSTLVLLALGDPKEPCLQFNYFVNFLKTNNIALIITISTKPDDTIYELHQSPNQKITQAYSTEKDKPEFSLKTLKSRVRFDSEILLGVSKMKEASKSIIPVRIVKCFRMPKGTRENFSLELSVNQDSVQWYLQGQKSPILEKLNSIYQYKNQVVPLTGREIALKLKIKESLLKKHVAQLKNRLAIRDPEKNQYFVAVLGGNDIVQPFYLPNYKPVTSKSAVELCPNTGQYFIIGRGADGLQFRYDLPHYQPLHIKGG